MADPFSSKAAYVAGASSFLLVGGYLRARYLKKIKISRDRDVIIFSCSGSEPFSVRVSEIRKLSAEQLATKMHNAIAMNKPNQPAPPYKKFYLAALKARQLADNIVVHIDDHRNVA